jgi:hypothetical protein
MKTLKFKNSIRITVIIAAMMFSATFTFAKNPPSAEKFSLAEFQKEMVQNQLDRSFEFPEEAKCFGTCGIVKADVKVAEDGSLIINEINGHPDFKDYVENKLHDVSIADYDLIGKRFIAKFDFRK